MPADWRPDANGTGRLLARLAGGDPAGDWQPVSCIRRPDGTWLATVSRSGVVTPTRVVVRLGPQTRPSDAGRVAEYLAGQAALELVAWRPLAGRAEAARLWPAHSRLRSGIAAWLRCEPWDLDLSIAWRPAVHPGDPHQIATVWVSGAPVIPDAERRRETWLGIARDLIPAVVGTTWWVDDRPSDGDGIIILRRAEDPLGAILPLPAVEPTVEAIPLARAADGSLVTVGLLELNMLLGGVPGSGKSGGLTALLCGISRLPHVAIVGVDPKRVELGLWRERCSVIARTDDEITEVLTRLVAEMERRYEWLEQRGAKKVTADMLSDELPLLVVVIDELADIVSIGVTKEDKEADAIRATLIRRLIAKGRAAAVSLIVATQKPQSDVVPTALRDLIQIRICYATTNAAMTDTVLGAGMSQQGGLSHEIPASLRGVCYVVTEGSRTPIRARTYWVPDEEVAGRAAATAHFRVPLPWLEPGPRPRSEPATGRSRSAGDSDEVIEIGELAPPLADLEGDDHRRRGGDDLGDDDPWAD